MYSFKEIVARLVVIGGIFTVVETRARYIYQPEPLYECLSSQSEFPCGGHTQETCNEYCETDGFDSGSCNGQCCLCFAPPGMLPLTQGQHSVIQKSSGNLNLPSKLNTQQPDVTPIGNGQIDLQHESEEINSEKPSTKPKRFAFISDDKLHSSKFVKNKVISKPVTNEIKENICLTPDCVKTANAILENLNENVNPCDDFYQFTCGNFQRNQPIPDDKGSVTLMGSLTDKLMEQLRTMLEDDRLVNSGKPLPHSTMLAKTLYDSCRNSDLLESKGMSPLTKLYDSLGGWPVVQGRNWKSQDWTWENSVANLKELGLVADYLLKVGVVPDLKKPDRRILNVGDPLLSFSREQLQHREFLDLYRTYQVNVAVLMGADKAQAAMEMAKVFEFETQLANASLPRELSRAHPLNFYHPTTISNLQSLHPSVNWLPYIQSLMPKDIDINEDQVVSVHSPEQLTKLLKIIAKTDKRVLANYLMWRAFSAVLPYLNQEAIQIQQEFVGAVSERKQRKPRWRECVDIVSTTLGQAVGAMYVRQHFDETSREIAIEMVNDIRQAFVQILTSVNWMDDDTKERAFEKVNTMKTNIGYPKELMDENILLNLYDGLVLSGDDFFGNILNLTKGASDFGFKKLNQPVIKNDWIAFGKPAVVNAFYQPTQNSIQFPAGILQGHFFDKTRPTFMNYGAIGWVIGHEISHGFDDQGSHFDSNGEIRDWWNPTTKRLFHEKARCLVNQYGSFTYADPIRNITVPINGIISVGENIADNSGIKQAYEGYQSWVRKHGQEKKLPGLKYSPNQLFWISAANNWCSKTRPEQMMEAIQMGIHSPGEYRIRGTFANMKQFAADFNCPVGSPMNPPTKCEVW